MSALLGLLSLVRVRPRTPDEQAAALLVALRASRDGDEAVRFRAALGLDGAA